MTLSFFCMVALYDIASFGMDYPFTRELIKMWQHLNFNFIEMLIWYNFLICINRLLFKVVFIICHCQVFS